MTEHAATEDPIERGVPRAWTRLRRGYVAAIAVLVVLLVVVGVVAAVALGRLSDIKAADARNACSDRLIGYAFDSAALTLSAPPAPSAQRVATAKAFIDSAHRLSNADEVCARTGNRPAPVTIPTP